MKALKKTTILKTAQTIPFPLRNWFLRKGYLQGAFWAIMINVVGSSNDVIMKYTGSNLHWVEIAFFRYLFSTLIILPFMFHQKELFKTEQIGNHFLRALIGTVALTACCFSVNFMPLYENTTIMFTQPLFFLIMAFFILKEKVDSKRWLCTLAGFIGLLVVYQPGTQAFQWAALVPVSAAVLFAYSDVINKTMVKKENTFTLLFYFGLGTTLLSFIPLLYVWKMPTLKEISLLALLGIGANLIQICIFKAFSATDASGLQPFRYVELITGGILGYLFFKEIPQLHVLYGAIIIIASTFFITIYERRKI